VHLVRHQVKVDRPGVGRKRQRRPSYVLHQAPGETGRVPACAVAGHDGERDDPLVALGGSAAGAKIRIAYFPMVEVVAKPTTVTGTDPPSLVNAFTAAAFGQALSRTLMPLTGLPSVPVTRPATNWPADCGGPVSKAEPFRDDYP
jgi:hypothetical protein